jgi:hypothetical protein
MTEIKRMDRPTVRRLSEEIEEALQGFAEHYGVQVKIGGATYTDTQVTFKVTVATFNDDGVAVTKEMKAWKLHAPMHGLDEDGVGRVYRIKGTDYQVDGWNTLAKRFPVRATRVQDGKSFKLTIEAVRGAVRQ